MYSVYFKSALIVWPTPMGNELYQKLCKLGYYELHVHVHIYHMYITDDVSIIYNVAILAPSFNCQLN